MHCFRKKIINAGEKGIGRFLPNGLRSILYELEDYQTMHFQAFIRQCLEAVILGCLIFASMKLLGLPYAVLIAVFIGVMSLIPIIGGLY